MKNNFIFLEENISKFTFGLKYEKERFEVFNKFGYLYDLLNTSDDLWSQKISTEAGHQLINLFEFTNKAVDDSIFISTSRLGFTFPYQHSKKLLLRDFCQNCINKSDSTFISLFTIFSHFTFSRFGFYFEFLLTPADIQNLNHLKFFQTISGNENTIDEFEEIQYRSSLNINKKNDFNYDKIIISFNKVLSRDSKSPEIRYLLTTDFQEYFNPTKIENSDSMINFVREKYENNYTKYFEYMTNLFTAEVN